MHTAALSTWIKRKGCTRRRHPISLMGLRLYSTPCCWLVSRYVLVSSFFSRVVLCHTYFMPVQQSEIRRSEHGTFVSTADFAKHRFLVFPILHQQVQTKRGMDHWTVLVVDNAAAEMRFYNSLRPRGAKKDPYIDDAKEVVGIILCTKPHNFQVPVWLQIINFLLLLRDSGKGFRPCCKGI